MSEYRNKHGRQITNLIASANEFQDRANTAGAIIELLEAYRRVYRATGAALAYFLPSRSIAPVRAVLTKLTGQRVTLNACDTQALFSELDFLQQQIAEIRTQANEKDGELRDYLHQNPPPESVKTEAPELFKLVKPYL